MRSVVLALLTPAAFASLTAQAPAIDFSGLDPALTVAPTEILVLGSAHLSNLGDGVKSADLDPLRDKLAAFRPDVITIESLPGEFCEAALAYPTEYPDIAKTYCRDMTPYRAESGLTMASALAEVRTSLKDWPASPTVAQRRRLAAAFLGANDRYSALVQWLRLAPGDRVAGDGLGEASTAYLDKLAISINENTQLGAMLAARLGLERVYPADDHSADIVYADLPEDAFSRMYEIWKSNPYDMKGEFKKLDSIMAGPEGMVGLYRTYNTPRMQALTTDGDFRLAMNDTSAVQMGRVYLTWWQTRNLRMVAHIVAAGGSRPGGRVLAIVGSSHKPYFDAYLDRMHDVKLVSVEEVLR